MAEQEINVDDKHSVEFSINAKGMWSGKVKCYGPTPQEALKRALEVSVKLDEIISKKNGG